MTGPLEEGGMVLRGEGARVFKYFRYKPFVSEFFSLFYQPTVTVPFSPSDWLVQCCQTSMLIHLQSQIPKPAANKTTFLKFRTNTTMDPKLDF